MADINVQRNVTTLTASQASNTSTISAVPSLGAAFCLSKCNRYIGGGPNQDTGAESSLDDFVSSIDLNTTTSVIARRNISNLPTYTQWHPWEVVSYIGPAGGANEFIVRQRGIIDWRDSNSTQYGANISTISNVDDCVVIMLGVESDHEFQRSDLMTGTLQLVANGTGIYRVEATRGSTSSTRHDLRYVVIEFTGSNWLVQKRTHTWTSAGVNETQAISSVGTDTSRAFVINTFRTSSHHSEATSALSYLTSPTVLNHRLDDKNPSPAGCTTICYVVSNPKLLVRHYNGALNDPVNYTAPRNITITAVNSLSTTFTFLQAITQKDSVGSGALLGTDQFGYELTSTTNVRIRRNRDVNSTGEYRLSVIELVETSSAVDTTDSTSSTDVTSGIYKTTRTHSETSVSGFETDGVNVSFFSTTDTVSAGYSTNFEAASPNVSAHSTTATDVFSAAAIGRSISIHNTVAASIMSDAATADSIHGVVTGHVTSSLITPQGLVVNSVSPGSIFSAIAVAKALVINSVFPEAILRGAVSLPIIFSVSDPDVIDGQTLTISGDSFGDSNQALVYLSSSPTAQPWQLQTKISQTDEQLVIRVVQGSTGLGTVYIFVVNDSGETNSERFIINLHKHVVDLTTKGKEGIGTPSHRYKPDGTWGACDVCGFVYRLNKLRKRWDGLTVCSDDWEYRHPQELLRTRPEKQIINARGGAEGSTISVNYPQDSNKTIPSSSFTSGDYN